MRQEQLHPIEFAVLDYCGISEPAFWEGYGMPRGTSPEANNTEAMIRRQFYLLFDYRTLFRFTRECFGKRQIMVQQIVQEPQAQLKRVQLLLFQTPISGPRSPS